jgi:hypothetical protein
VLAASALVLFQLPLAAAFTRPDDCEHHVCVESYVQQRAFGVQDRVCTVSGICRCTVSALCMV